MTRSLTLRVLGRFEAQWADGEPVELNSRKAQLLLAYLAVEHSRSHTRDYLATLLWEDLGDERARHNLRQTLSKIRQQCSCIVAADGDRLAVDTTACEVDVREFEELAGSNDPDELRRGLDLYRGELLEGVVPRETLYEEWLQSARDRLFRTACAAGGRLAAALRESGRLEEAIDALNDLLAIDPANESAHRELMMSLDEAGRRSDALRQYRVCVDALQRELAAEPSIETQQLHAMLKKATRGPGGLTEPGMQESSPVASVHAPPGDDQKAQHSKTRAAILYADIANYSGLCALDEDETHRQVGKYLDLFGATVEKHQGHVHHYAGDAVLATFESPEDAVTCAVAVQREFSDLNEQLAAGRRIEFRIGINEGSVIHDRGDVYGDDVNIAARLEGLAVPGAICISETVKQSLGHKIPGVVLSYMGERSLKNIPRRVGAYLAELEGAQAPSNVIRSRTGTWLHMPERPSLAVMPFECPENDTVAARFADGLTMEVTTELIKLSGLFLASDFSTLRYRREQPSVQAVSRELGVRYLLRGTVDRSDDKLRVHAQLIDAMTGSMVWAERHESAIDDVFQIQDAITESIITALDVKLVSGKRSHVTRRSLSNREALKHYYYGWSHLIAGTREDLVLAQREFETAAEIEPLSPLPPAMASWTYWWEGFRMLSGDTKTAFERAEHFAKRAQELEDPNGFSNMVMAHLHLLKREHDQAFQAAQYALKLSPSCDVSAANFANVLNYLDRSKEAIEYAERAIRLTPIAPTIYPGILASSYYGADRFEDAVFTAHAVIEHNPGAVDTWLVLAAAESALGNESAAGTAVNEALRLKTGLTLDTYLESQPYAGETPLEKLADRLRRAGLN